MTEKTQLENLERDVDDVLFGKVKGLSGVDKSMLERSPTNKLVWDAHQSELHLATRLLYRALYTLDNVNPEYRRVQNQQTGDWHMEAVINDDWKWLLEIEKHVFDNQLTVKGYSRSQHLHQTATAAGVSGDDDNKPSFFERLFR